MIMIPAPVVSLFDNPDSPYKAVKPVRTHNHNQERRTTRMRRTSTHKYLEAAMMVDEVVQGNYGNLTTEFVLMVGNIVSNPFLLYNRSHTKPLYDVMVQANALVTCCNLFPFSSLS